MDNTLIIIVFLVAVIVSVGFLLVVLTLVPAIQQFKALLKDMEKTSNEVRALALQLRIVSGKIELDIDKVDGILDSTGETVQEAKESLKFINTNLLKRSAGLLALLPAIKFGWNLVKKLKRR